jgi:hypothetical protein
MWKFTVAVKAQMSGLFTVMGHMHGRCQAVGVGMDEWRGRDQEGQLEENRMRVDWVFLG